MRWLWRSPTIRSAAVFGAAGVGFAAANLILARALSPTEYALVTLVVALVTVGVALAPAGMDGIVNRRALEAGPRLLKRVLFATTATGLIFALVGALAYHTPASLAAMIFVATAVGGSVAVAAAKFQSEKRFGLSLALFQSPNLILLLAALVTAAAGVREAWVALLIVTLGGIPGAVWGWRTLFRERHAKPERSAEFPWSESLSYAGVQTSQLLMVQLERLALPHLLPLRELATYGVLAAIAGSLFRILQMGVGYSLLPRLRAAADVRQRRRLVAKEAKLVGAIVLLSSTAIWVVTPVVERWFLAGKYHLAGALVLATVVSGVAKVINGFSKSTVSALATPRELSVIAVLGWASVAVGLVAAIVGARWGLAGVIYGVAVGWLVRATSSFYVAGRHLRLPASERALESATAP